MNVDSPVLIAGVGSIGERHVRCFQAGGRVPLAICEINPALRAEVAERYGIERVYADFSEALKEPHRAAVIATPAHRHVAMATEAAAAGLHLLIEKPLSTGFEGIDELRGIVAEKERTAAVAYTYRAHPVLTGMKKAIDSGRFGVPLQIVATCGQNFPTYRPAYRDIYYRDHATGGGAVQDVLTHIINAGEWLVGPVNRLVADAAHLALEGVEVEDTVHVLARHGPVLGSYSLNQHQAPNEITLTVICERGTVRFENHFNRWRSMTEPETEWQGDPPEPFERDSLFVAQSDAFLDAIENQADTLCSLEEGIQSLSVNLAVLASVEQRSWVELAGNK